MFYFSNIASAQCDICDVHIEYSGDDIYLNSDCNDQNYAHVWTVTSKRCGDHYNNATTNFGSLATLYNLACEGTTISCEWVVRHCIYPVKDGGSEPDLSKPPLCCTDIVLQ